MHLEQVWNFITPTGKFYRCFSGWKPLYRLLKGITKWKYEPFPRKAKGPSNTAQ